MDKYHESSNLDYNCLFYLKQIFEKLPKNNHARYFYKAHDNVATLLTESTGSHCSDWFNWFDGCLQLYGLIQHIGII